MSSRTKPKSRSVLDTCGFNKFRENNSLLVYTVLTFLVVLALYWGTKDWKGFTAPEEVDLGPVGVPQQRRRRKSYTQRYRDYED